MTKKKDKKDKKENKNKKEIKSNSNSTLTNVSSKKRSRTVIGDSLARLTAGLDSVLSSNQATKRAKDGKSPYLWYIVYTIMLVEQANLAR